MLERASATEFNPYVDWLGIPARELPANYYRLLGLQLFEGDTAKIAEAADERLVMLRSLATGKRFRESEQLLNEVMQAKLCLLDGQKRAAYDSSLRERIKALRLRPLPDVPVLIAHEELPSRAPDHIENSIPDDPDAWIQPRRSSFFSKRLERWIIPTIVGLLAVASLVIALLLR